MSTNYFERTILLSGSDRPHTGITEPTASFAASAATNHTQRGAPSSSALSSPVQMGEPMPPARTSHLVSRI